MDFNAASWNNCLEYAELSDLGLRRANNQDSKAVVIAGSQEKWTSRGHLFIVADGMGAHAAGELASQLATEIVPLAYYKLVDQPPSEALLAAIQDANAQIHGRGQASEDFRGMGTTVTALSLLPQGALIAHVGDSRCYRLRGHHLEQLTFDHSLVWELRASGQIPADAIPAYVPKNVITRSLGPNPQVQVDLEGPFPVEVGDVFLLCSDGLSGQVKDEEIGQLLACMPLGEAVQALVDLANLRGGPDNITVVALRITAPLSPPATGSSESPALKRPVHPVIWGLLGVFSVLGLGLASVGMLLPAGLCALGAVGAGIAAWVQRYGRGGLGFDAHPLGRGPYTTCECPPDASFVGTLQEIVDQLRHAATREGWNLDWTQFNGHCQAAEAAAQAGRLDEAVREQCRAISSMMRELKQQRPRRRSNGVIDL